MKRPCAIALNWRFPRGVRIELVSDEQDDALLEQAIVESAEKLGRKQRNETPRPKQMGNVLHQGGGTLADVVKGHSQLCAANQTL